MTRHDIITLALAAVVTIVAGILHYAGAGPIAAFVASAAALALLASVVGRGTDELGGRLGPGATGVLQSALGNLPELFVSLFALRAGLVDVVRGALVGSILANSLLVLGLAFIVGGVRHGKQRFASETPRMIAMMLFLAVAALTLPTLAARIHSPAALHESALSAVCAIVLLAVFLASLPFSMRGDPTVAPPQHVEAAEAWPLWLSIVVLAMAGVGAAFVSDWFVDALLPATHALGLSEAFTGLVVVAIAGNAIENVVGIQLAAANKSDYAVSVILNSSLQVALALTPVLVLLSFVVGPTPLTLVLPPLLVTALALSAVITALIVYDGESIWLEGVALVGLYVLSVAPIWWG
ncbi:MAG TPA: calcium/proton exchanger [Gemmatimonadaceae bacterium]|nr:calcium/proton exchanger [Gemmatimonadaceae bacterium]